jgi:hypothetical protein
MPEKRSAAISGSYPQKKQAIDTYVTLGRDGRRFRDGEPARTGRGDTPMTGESSSYVEFSYSAVTQRATGALDTLERQAGRLAAQTTKPALTKHNTGGCDGYA